MTHKVSKLNWIKPINCSFCLFCGLFKKKVHLNTSYSVFHNESSGLIYTNLAYCMFRINFLRKVVLWSFAFQLRGFFSLIMIVDFFEWIKFSRQLSRRKYYQTHSIIMNLKSFNQVLNFPFGLDVQKVVYFISLDQTRLSCIKQVFKQLYKNINKW